jgi:hypothetical protein
VEISGQCYCSAVSYSGTADPAYTCDCHCLDCRRLSGSGHLALMLVPAGAMTFSGPLQNHSGVVDSGARVSNHFCGVCGSQIYKSGEMMPDMAFIVASTLDDPEIYQPQASLYMSRALSWDAPNPATEHFTEMPPAGA